MSAHIRSAQVDFGGGIRRAPRPERDYLDVAHQIIRHPGLSYLAIGVLIRLLSNAPEVTQTADDLWAEKSAEVRGRRGGGRRAILNALTELRLAGYLQTFVFQWESGCFQTVNTIFDLPQPVPDGWARDEHGRLSTNDPAKISILMADAAEFRAQVIEKTEVRLPTIGQPTIAKRTSIEVTKEVPGKPKQHAQARAAQANAAADGGKRQRQLRIVHGIDCWTADDLEAAEALACLHGAESVAAAANAIRRAGASPLPGRVLKKLQEAQGEATRQAAGQRVLDRERESRERALREMEELMAKRQERDT